MERNFMIIEEVDRYQRSPNDDVTCEMTTDVRQLGPVFVILGGNFKFLCVDLITFVMNSWLMMQSVDLYVPTNNLSEVEVP